MFARPSYDGLEENPSRSARRDKSYSRGLRRTRKTSRLRRLLSSLRSRNSFLALARFFSAVLRRPRETSRLQRLLFLAPLEGLFSRSSLVRFSAVLRRPRVNPFRSRSTREKLLAHPSVHSPYSRLRRLLSSLSLEGLFSRSSLALFSAVPMTASEKTLSLSLVLEPAAPSRCRSVHLARPSAGS
jgi:hypothetical protein